MDSKKFSDTALGDLVEINAPQSRFAFCPHPLPSSWELPRDLFPLLIEARQAIGLLDGIGRHMSNPRLLITPLQRREALRSSSMEGTYATPEELFLFEAETEESTEARRPASAVLEVANYARALNAGQRLIDTGHPLSLAMLRSLHGALLSGVRGSDQSPGVFRTGQVQIGADARFMPPPPYLLADCLDSLQESLETGVAVEDPLIFAFMVHYQFETIHPFNDGNGRVGRLLLSLQIYSALGLSAPWLYMSAFFERHKDEYIDNLFRVSTHGDWKSWVEFCLRAAADQALDAVKRSDALIDLHQRYRQLTTASGANARVHSIVDGLFESPVITVPRATDVMGVTYPTAKSDLDRLVDLEVLTIGPERHRPRFYFAREIIRMAYAEE